MNDGTTSSSDGQFFRGGKRGAIGGDINARYGVDPGFSFYTHVSDQHGPYHVKVISVATHEAPYVLDGLLHHGSNVKIAEHYTDTGGATGHVFALCAMLDSGFVPGYGTSRIGAWSRSISLPPHVEGGWRLADPLAIPAGKLLPHGLDRLGIGPGPRRLELTAREYLI
jgi:Tn3 transposase DDE domain